MPEETQTKETVKRARKAERYLRCVFTDAQTLELSRELSQHLQARVQTEADKKRVVKDFDARLADLDAKVESASEKIRSGYEMRNVPCTVRLHDPRPGLKTIVRDDTGEAVEAVAMTDAEMQEELPLGDAPAPTPPPREPVQQPAPAPALQLSAPEPAAIDVQTETVPPAPETPAPSPTPARSEMETAPQPATLLILLSAESKSAAFAEALTNATKDTLRAALKKTVPGRKQTAIAERLAALESAAT